MVPKTRVELGSAIHAGFEGTLPYKPPDEIFSYITLRRNCCLSFRAELPDLSADVVTYTAQIAARNAYEVWVSASGGDPGDCLELGLRMWAGCGSAKDQDGALEWWERIANPTHSARPISVPRPIQAKALSCLANAYDERSNLPDSTLQIDDFYRASRLADACASLGFVTPTVLWIAGKVERLGLRRQSDCRFKGVDTARFEKLDFLWEAADARAAEMSAEHRMRDVKVSRAPSRYRCAAEGCGIESTRKAGLYRCSGKCPVDLKPSYCSKECQITDWKTHRINCKLNADVESKTAPPTSQSADDTIKEHMRTDGKELAMKIPAPGRPGGEITLTSTTMSPALMKQIRDQFGKKASVERKSWLLMSWCWSNANGVLPPSGHTDV